MHLMYPAGLHPVKDRATENEKYVCMYMYICIKHGVLIGFVRSQLIEEATKATDTSDSAYILHALK